MRVKWSSKRRLRYVPGWLATTLLTAAPLTAAEPSSASTGAPAATAQAAPTPAAAPAAATGDAERDLEAGALYRLSLELITQGKFDAARTFLGRLQKDYADTRYRALAGERLKELELLTSPPGGQGGGTSPTGSSAGGTNAGSATLAPASPSPASPAPAPVPRASKGMRDDKAVNGGRAELVVSQTLAGSYMGGLLPYTLGEEDEKAMAAGAVIGAGAGLLVSMGVTKQNPVSTAEAQALYMGEIWGNQASVMFCTGLEVKGSRCALLGIPLIGAAGLVAQRQLGLDSGQMSFAGSTAVWTEYALGALMLSMEEEGGATMRQVFLTVPVASTAAFGLAMLESSTLTLSRSRVRLVNLGGFLGTLLMGAGYIIVQPDIDNAFGVSVPLLMGSGAGLLAGALLTRDWDHTYNPYLFATTDTPSLVAYEGGRLALGSPVPMLSLARSQADNGETQLKPQVTVSLLSGRW